MNISQRLTLYRAIGALMPLALVGCDQASGPRVTRPVTVRVAASATPQASPAGAAAADITSFRLSIGQAALGGGDQFGCVDCQDTGPETPVAPAVIAVPLNGQPVEIATEQVGPGTYALVEIAVVRPAAAPTGWPADATMELAGTFNGKAFTVTFPVAGGFRETVSPAVVVSSTAASPSKVSVTIKLPVGKWFTAANDTGLDPTDPAQRAQIEANVRASFAGPEENEPASAESEP